MASVKTLLEHDPPTATELGIGTFVFSDAYSVFDWGQMPDEIPEKGASLCSMGAATFEALEADGIPTHYLGVGDAEKPDSINDCEEAPDRMVIELTTVPELPFDNGVYDYAHFHAVSPTNYLIPLEIVYRNTVPIGSSLRRRTDPATHDLDFAEWPDHSVDLVEPVVEFSTKFESSDRYLDRSEAEEIAGEAPLDRLETLARDVNQTVTRLADRAGLTHLDGKIECLYHDGTIKVADVAGTLDENRFSYDGRQLSKEVIRQYYSETNPAWVAAVREAKKAAAANNDPDWRKRVSIDPEPLPATAIDTVADMYGAVANEYVDQHLFTAPPLHAVANRLDQLIEV